MLPIFSVKLPDAVWFASPVVLVNTLTLSRFLSFRLVVLSILTIPARPAIMFTLLSESTDNVEAEYTFSAGPAKGVGVFVLP